MLISQRNHLSAYQSGTPSKNPLPLRVRWESVGAVIVFGSVGAVLVLESVRWIHWSRRFRTMQCKVANLS